MITVVTYWESSQMRPDVEWRMWRQIRGAFTENSADMQFKFVPVIDEMEGYTFDQYETMEEALASTTGKRVFLEASGSDSVANIPQDEDIVLILGNTEHDNLDHVREEDLVLRINTLGTAALYGLNAAAIALAYRVGQ